MKPTRATDLEQYRIELRQMSLADLVDEAQQHPGGTAWDYAVEWEIAERDAEAEAIKRAAHMPADWDHGLPSWINQRLYAAYVGAYFSDEVMQQINAGRLTFPESPDGKAAESLRMLARL